MRENTLTCDVGGLTRRELGERLSGRGVRLNDHARTLLAHPCFEPRGAEMVTVVRRPLAELDLLEGGTLPQIRDAVEAYGLDPCPPDTGPYLRLALTAQEQAPDAILSAGRVPTGALTVLSTPLSSDHEVPKGFYLRVVEGVEWLRGFRCDDEYVWPPDSLLALRCREPLEQ